MRRALPAVVLALLALCASAPPAAAVPLARGVPCPSIAGLWRARADKPGVNEIITVTLHDAGGRFVGTAVTDYWYGPPGMAAPVAGHCAPNDVHRLLTGSMEAQRTGDRLAWWVTGGGALSEDDVCGGPVGTAHAVGRTEGHVDLARGIFDGTFLVASGTRAVRYLHLSCSAP